MNTDDIRFSDWSCPDFFENLIQRICPKSLLGIFDELHVLPKGREDPRKLLIGKCID